MTDDLPDPETRRLTRLLARDGAADYELDLTGLDLPHALASIDQMVERQRFREDSRTVAVRLDPATETSGETLFQPVGRHLLALMKRDLIDRCSPRPNSDGGGFVVELPGHPRDGGGDGSEGSAEL